MKVLATRRYPGPAFEELQDVEVASLASLRAPRPDVEALLAANESVPLDLLPGLRLVANFGVGYDRLGVAELGRQGIAVTNTPGVLSAATADLTFALILAVRRRVVEGDRAVRAGAWTGSWADGFLAEELTGATLGATVSAPPAIVTVHAPLTADTHGLIDAQRLALLQDGASLVNTSRGEILDEPALVAELVSGRLRAGLDVFAHEPHVPEELLSLPNVVLTPHLGSGTRQTREAMTRLAVDNLLAFERGAPLLTPVLPG